MKTLRWWLGFPARWAYWFWIELRQPWKHDPYYQYLSAKVAQEEAEDEARVAERRAAREASERERP